jgi:hypothetical protein
MKRVHNNCINLAKKHYSPAFLSLFIHKKTATTKPITTKANTPIMIVPFTQETREKFKKFISHLFFSVKLKLMFFLLYDKNQFSRI